nr:hypothetical protein [uncultured Prevotella sp.]
MKRKRIEEFVVSLENDQITKDESALVLGGNSGWFDKKKETNNCGCTNVSPCNSTVTNNCACENVSKPNPPVGGGGTGGVIKDLDISRP